MDRKRNILEAKSKSKQSFKETFGLVLDGEKYAGILAIATLSLVNEIKDIVGSPPTILTTKTLCFINIFLIIRCNLMQLGCRVHYFSIKPPIAVDTVQIANIHHIYRPDITGVLHD